MIAHLTERLAKSVKPNAARNTIIYDDAVKRFGIRVTQVGAKSFMFS